ncbi:hypothetical protein BS17DRAFT_774063 [Gyrodon lividus]|nr:hypothetical protein BS17DRAFT_774063 [Gyrodon lividus]
MVMEELTKLQDSPSYPNAVEQGKGGMMAGREVESMDFDRGKEIAKVVEEQLGHRKRKHKANMLYTHSFWLDQAVIDLYRHFQNPVGLCPCSQGLDCGGLEEGSVV